jgi:hypothetical protein
VPIRIKGLDALYEKHKSAYLKTKSRWSGERSAVIGYARRISPVDTGQLKRSWFFRMTPGRRGAGFILVNESARNGRTYAEFVHRAGETVTVAELVQRYADDRAPALARDLARLFADHINGAS